VKVVGLVGFIVVTTGGLVGFIVVTTGGLVGVVTLLIVVLVLGGCVTVRIGLLVTTPRVGGVGRETLRTRRGGRDTLRTGGASRETARTGGGFFLNYWAPSVVVTPASFDVCANACGDAYVATATANAAIKMLMDVRIKNPPILIRFPRGPFRERERSNA